MAIRLALGGSATEANLDSDLAAGRFPPEYTARFSDAWFFFDALQKTLLGLGALWLGLHTPAGWYRRALVCVPLLLLATWLLSARIQRVEGVLALVLIPGVLRLVERHTKP